MTTNVLVGRGQVRAGVVGREYLRVSKDRSGRERSIVEQQGDNQRAAEELGWTLGEPYSDVSISASRYSRKARGGYATLISDLKADRFAAGVLIMWESSRGSRRVSEWCELIELCELRGVLIHVTTHGRTYNPANARDRRSLLEDAVDSEYESSKMAARVARSHASRAREGQPVGIVPFGYRREYELVGGRRVVRQVVDPEQAAIVREIYQKLAKGQSLRSLAVDLQRRGVLGATWSPYRVRDLALKACYAGLREHVAGRRNGKYRPGDTPSFTEAQWPKIVDRELYWTVRRLLTDPGRRTVTRPGRHKHLLSMIAACGVCGGVLTVKVRGGRSEYRCRDKGCVGIAQQSLDDYVIGIIHAQLANPAFMARLADAEGDTESELSAARGELAGIREHYQQMRDLLGQRKITPASFAEVEPGIVADLEQAQQRVQELETPSELRGLLLGDPGRAVAERWDGMPIVGRRGVVKALFDSITVNRSRASGVMQEAHERTMVRLRQRPPRVTGA
jgi:site-specific DNA recombinase